jgi:hypothetical protein
MLSLYQCITMVYENKDCVVLNGHCRLYSEILIFFQVTISQLLCIEMITVPEYNLKSILYIYYYIYILLILFTTPLDKEAYCRSLESSFS